MFHLSSTATKISVLAFSVLASLSAMDSVTVGFQYQSQISPVAVLPAVTIVGHRVDLAEGDVHVSLNSKHANAMTTS